MIYTGCTPSGRHVGSKMVAGVRLELTTPAV